MGQSPGNTYQTIFWLAQYFFTAALIRENNKTPSTVKESIGQSIKKVTVVDDAEIQRNCNEKTLFTTIADKIIHFNNIVAVGDFDVTN